MTYVALDPRKRATLYMQVGNTGSATNYRDYKISRIVERVLEHFDGAGLCSENWWDTSPTCRI